MTDRKHIDRRRASRFVASSSLVTGATALLCGAGQVDAELIPFSPPGGPVTLHPYLSGGPYYTAVNIDGDGQIDFFIEDLSYFGSFHLYGWPSYQTNLIMNDGSLAMPIAPGSSVGPDATGWPNTVSLDSFLGTRGYAGVVFDIPGGSPHFAYLDIEISVDRSVLTFYGGAYESQANTPIQVPIPEPASLALLAGGAVSLAAWRRRREP
jgi:hypothetical protein